MRNRLTGILVCASLLMVFSNAPLNAEVCSSTWTSSNPNFVHPGSATWQQNLPISCSASCAKITINILVGNYNGAGKLDLFCSNIVDVDYGNPFYEKKMGWIGQIGIPVGSGWRTVSFPLRLPHFEWLNDNGSIYFSLQGPIYLGVEARSSNSLCNIANYPMECRYRRGW